MPKRGGRREGEGRVRRQGKQDERKRGRSGRTVNLLEHVKHAFEIVVVQIPNKWVL